MSVSIATYKIEKLTAADKKLLQGTFVDEVVCPDEKWDYKFYSKAMVEKDPERYTDIIKLAVLIPMKETVTDYKQCYIDHGMPADTKYYSSCSRGYGFVVSWEGGTATITSEELDKYSHVETKEFYVVKHSGVDADVSNWLSRLMMNALEEKTKLSLDYRPLRVDKDIAVHIWDAIFEVYDEGDLYEDIMNFVVEITKCMLRRTKDNLFIEFQD